MTKHTTHINIRKATSDDIPALMHLFECAKAIIQSGIKTVVYAMDKYKDSDSVIASKKMFDAAGVRYYEYDKSDKTVELHL